jgi:hemerythrin-like domain-containing protein
MPAFMNSIAARLTQDHEQLEALMRRLAEDAEAPVSAVLANTWTTLETKLVRHMEAEERFLLPLIEASNPHEVKRIQLEHARIRDLLSELGLAVELHTIRRPHVDELLETLRAHAKHEDEALYCLAGEKASRAVEHSIAEFLRHPLAVAKAVVESTRAPDSTGNRARV